MDGRKGIDLSAIEAEALVPQRLPSFKEAEAPAEPPPVAVVSVV
jgi:hypothetical protein